jgi:hypothetical protein
MQGVFLCADAISFGDLYCCHLESACWSVRGWRVDCFAICSDFWQYFAALRFAKENNGITLSQGEYALISEVP